MSTAEYRLHFGDILYTHRKKIASFLMKLGNAFTFRYLLQKKACLPINGLYNYEALEHFTQTLASYGFGDVQIKLPKSNSVFVKRRYTDMTENGKQKFNQLQLDEESYHKTFIYELLT